MRGSLNDPARRAIAHRVIDAVEDLLPHMGAVYQQEIEECARLTPERLEREVLRTSRRFIEQYFRRVSAGRRPSKVDLSGLARAGRRDDRVLALLPDDGSDPRHSPRPRRHA